MQNKIFSQHQGYYSWQRALDYPLACAFSSRAQENMSLSYGDARHSLEHRRDFLNQLGIDYQNLVCGQQVHGNAVAYVEGKDIGRGALSYDSAIAHTDALITDRRHIPLAIFTADCLSVFLHDPLTPAIGLVHAGWRSTKAEITLRAIELMQEKFNTSAKDLSVAFGPALRTCCYEVGEEFQDFFPQGILRKNNRYYLDLVEINKQQALTTGVTSQNIFDGQICTSCRNHEFFSYRRESKNCGRMMSVVMLL